MYQLFYNHTHGNTEIPETATATSAVVLVGDAVHAFPPDLGQGVNSALEDVFALHRALERHDNSIDEGRCIKISFRQ
jgi:2-polyprenyl-6-methoxyphenol hydroxylase-like FAD-dependent oxidoreductase